VLHLGVIQDGDAERFRRAVERIHQRLAAAEEEGVGARQRERARQRGLEHHAAGFEEARRVLAGADAQAREVLVRLAGGDALQVVPVLVLEVAVGQHPGGARVQGAQVAGVAGIAAAHRARRVLGDDNARTGPARRDGGAERGIAAARDQHVEGFSQVHHRSSFPGRRTLYPIASIHIPTTALGNPAAM
jgi:hypothetical protein